MFELDQTKTLAATLQKTKTNITYKPYANLDHGFRRPDGVRDADKVIEDIKQWLQQH